MTVEQFVARLEAKGLKCERKPSGQFRCQCPAHARDDSDTNLAVDPGKYGGIVVTCHSHQCEPEAIAGAVGLRLRDLMPERLTNGTGRHAPEAVYPYEWEDGSVRYEVVREADKRFWQRLPGAKKGGIGNVERILFRLPQLLKTAPGDVVGICEGEKDTLNLEALGIAGTTNPGGAGKWRQSFTEWLKSRLPGRRFAVLPDNDEPGTQHAVEVEASLKRAGLDVVTIILPGLEPKGDVTDWIKAGGTAEELRKLAAPPPHPIISKLLSREQLRNLPPPVWQIEGLFQEQSIVEIYGESNHGKSLVGVDIGLSIVRAGSWASRPILKPGPVIYINADGGPGFSDRLRWWEKANGTDAVWEFWTYPEEIVLHSREEMGQFTEGLALLEEAPAMIFFDTLSQCIPGANENMQDEMSLVVRHLNAIKRRYGSTVVLLHHVGKDGLNRGSTVIPGAADTIIRVSQLPGDIVELRCDKQRGGRKFDPIYFTMERHGTDEGVYLAEADSPGQEALRSAREQQVLDVLQSNGHWLSREEVKARTLGLSAASIYRYLKSLVGQGLVEEGHQDSVQGPPTKLYRAKQAEEGTEARH